MRRQRKNRAHTNNVPLACPAYIKRTIPYYAFCDEEALVRMEDYADTILQEKGICYYNDDEALKLFKDAGCDVKGDIIRFEKGLARHLASTAPSSFMQEARNPKKSVMMGDDNMVFAPVYGPPFIRSLDEDRRYGTLDDLQKLIKIVSQLPYLHHSGGIIVEPCDIPVNKRHLRIIYSHIKYSDKPFLGMITEKDRAEDSVALAQILYGKDYLENHCVIMGNVNANSPLLIDKVASEAAQVYSSHNQAMIIVPFILSGAMGPVTTAGSIAQAVAEALSYVAFTQIIRKGSPVILGNFLSSMSLKSGAPTFGMPEPVMSNYAIGQIARRLHLPLRSGGSLTASKALDTQAASESADSMHSTIIGGANFVLHAAGWLEAGLVTSIEKILLDHDRLGVYQKMLQGFACDDNGLASLAHQEVAHGKHFLGCEHTMQNYKNAFYESSISDSESYEQWLENGAVQSPERANKIWKNILSNYTLPPLDEAINDELLEFITKKEQSKPDAWY